MKVCIFTVDEILSFGLFIVGFDEGWQARVKRRTNLKRFKQVFGSHPAVYTAMWKDLQRASNNHRISLCLVALPHRPGRPSLPVSAGWYVRLEK